MNETSTHGARTVGVLETWTGLYIINASRTRRRTASQRTATAWRRTWTCRATRSTRARAIFLRRSATRRTSSPGSGPARRRYPNSRTTYLASERSTINSGFYSNEVQARIRRIAGERAVARVAGKRVETLRERLRRGPRRRVDEDVVAAAPRDADASSFRPLDCDRLDVSKQQRAARARAADRLGPAEPPLAKPDRPPRRRAQSYAADRQDAAAPQRCETGRLRVTR
mmetsp:Transcript_23005/g.69100  ORF Transcript_23005/g.69100 Transcript_23005/m.69100 type:complete len:227 (-) Transcript_23005:566-1246(-)